MLRLAAVAFLLLTAACGSDPAPPSADSAGDAVTRLLRALDAGSCTAVKKIVVTPDAIDCEEVGQLRGSYTEEGVNLNKVKTSTGKVNGSSATVTVDLGTDDADESWQVERVGGAWRVVFDSVE
jgi:hypothetical protein